MPGDLLTPAELVALQQVLSGGGAQTLSLNDHGAAVGGTFNLNQTLAQQISNLIVPQNVTAIHDFAGSAVANIAGNLTNQGTILAVSSSNSQTSATISASNIFNMQSGLISSVLPNGGVLGYSNLLSSLNLTLSAVHDIINAGAITSSGNLTAMAGGSIVNALPAGVAGTAPIMQAMGNINLLAGSGLITNAGTIASLAGNVNLAALTAQTNVANLAQNLLIQNTGGVIQALNGAINIRDELFAGKALTELRGGDWLSRELNIYGGSGKATASVGEVTGTANIYAHEAHFWAAAEHLRLGEFVLTGDPTIVSLGDLTVPTLSPTNGATIALIAQGNIYAPTGSGSFSIDSSASSDNGGAVLIIAGAHCPDCDPNNLPEIITVSNVEGSDSGGSIVFDGETGRRTLTQITSASTNSGGLAGDIWLVAYKGTAADSGRILLPSSSTINASADFSGAVNILAGGELGSGAPTISIGGITTMSSNQNSLGNLVRIETAQPHLPGDLLVSRDDPTSFSFTSGPFEAAAGGYKIQSIVTGSLNLAGFTQLEMRAGAHITAGAINTPSGSVSTTTILAGLNANGDAAANAGNVIIQGQNVSLGFATVAAGTGNSTLTIAAPTGSNLNLTFEPDITSMFVAPGGVFLEAPAGREVTITEDLDVSGSLTIQGPGGSVLQQVVVSPNSNIAVDDEGLTEGHLTIRTKSFSNSSSIRLLAADRDIQILGDQRLALPVTSTGSLRATGDLILDGGAGELSFSANGSNTFNLRAGGASILRSHGWISVPAAFTIDARNEDGTADGTLQIVTPSLSNAGVLSAIEAPGTGGTLSVAAPTGANLAISGGGSLRGDGSISVSTGSGNSVSFNGAQTFTTDTTITTSSLSVNAPVNVTGGLTVTSAGTSGLAINGSGSGSLNPSSSASDEIKFSAAAGQMLYYQSSLTGLLNGNVTIETNGLSNSGNLRAVGTLAITSPVGSDLVFVGTGTLNAGSGTIAIAPASGQELFIVGNQTIARSANFTTGLIAFSSGSVLAGSGTATKLSFVSPASLTVIGQGSVSAASAYSDAISFSTGATDPLNFQGNVQFTGNTQMVTSELNNTGTINSVSGSLHIMPGSGDITVSGTGTVVAANPATISTSSGQAIHIDGAQTVAGSIGLVTNQLVTGVASNLDASGQVTVTAHGTGGLTVSGTSGGKIAGGGGITFRVPTSGQQLAWNSGAPSLEGNTTFSTDAFVGNSSVSARAGDTLTISSALLGTDLTIDGSGTGELRAGGGITLTAGTTGNSVNVVQSQSLFGNTTVTASGPGGSVSIASGASLMATNFSGTGSGSITVVTSELNLNSGGEIIANGPSGAVAVSSPAALTLTATSGQLAGAGGVSISSGAGTLSTNLGSVDTSGPLTFVARGVGAQISIESSFTTNGDNLTFLSEGDIVTASGAGAISAGSASGDGGNVLMIAGATIAGDGPAFVVSGPLTGGGGDIDLSTGIAITAFDAGSGASGGKGGSVTLIAFNEGTGGTVTLPEAVAVTTGGGTGGANGNVVISAGATVGTAVTAGDIDATGGANGTGRVRILSGNPETGGGVGINNGQVVSGAFVFPEAGDPARTADVTTGSLSAGREIDVILGGAFTLAGNASASADVSIVASTLDYAGAIVTSGANSRISVSSESLEASLTVAGAGPGTMSASGGIELRAHLFQDITISSSQEFNGPVDIITVGGVVIGSGVTLTGRDFSGTGSGSITLAALVIDLNGTGRIVASGAGGHLQVSNPDTPGTAGPVGFLGGGELEGAGGINIIVSESDLAFEGGYTLNGPAFLSATGGIANVGVGPGGVVHGTGDMTVEAANLVNVDGFQADGSFVFNKLVGSALGGGTLANSLGSIILTSSIVMPGQNLTILAAGDVVALSSARVIDLSSTTGNGGSLNILAGVDFTPGTDGTVFDSTTVFGVTGPSSQGGAIQLDPVAVNTGSTVGRGGDIFMTAYSGSAGAGVIRVGALSGNGGGGSGGVVSVWAEGGIEVNGPISVNGTRGGNVFLVGSELASSDFQLYFQNGNRGGIGGVIQDTLISAPPSPIVVKGDISLSGSASYAGQLSIRSSSTVDLRAGITATGVTNLTVANQLVRPAGGLITIETDGGAIRILGNINASASSSSAPLLAGVGGIIDMRGAGFIYVNGNIVATGGDNSGTGSGGVGGLLVLRTINLNGDPENPNMVGSVDVAGYVDLRGGSALGGGLGGAGGLMAAIAGTVQVRGKSRVGSASIDVTNGNGLAGPVSGTVTIVTLGTQPLPVNFDLLSTRASEFALPGGLFSVGDSSVNGTAGPILSTSGMATATNGAGRIVEEQPFVSGNIAVNVFGSMLTANLGSGSVQVSSDNGSGQRTLVTPGQALALYELSRGPSQGTQLNSSGQVIDGSAVTIRSEDLFKPFETFKLLTASPGTNDITFSIIGDFIVLPLSSRGSLEIGGTLEFLGDSARLDLGSRSPVILSTGAIIADNQALTINTTGGKWSNFGLIKAGDLLVAGPRSLGITMGTTGVLSGPTSGAGTLNIDAGGLAITGGQISNMLLSLGPSATSRTSVKVTGTSFTNGASLADLGMGGLTLNVSGDFTVPANTVWNVSSAVVIASGNLTLNSQSKILSTGAVTLTASGVLTLDAVSELRGGKSVSLTGNLGVTGAGTGGPIVAGAVTVKSGGDISLSGYSFGAGKTFSFTGAQISLVGDFGSSAVNVTGTGINLVSTASSLSVGKLIATSGVTLASTAGDISLTSALSLPGQDLTIVAAGSVLASNKAKSIDVSSSGDGGLLTIMAGYQVSLAMSGAQVETVNVAGPSSGKGSIQMPATLLKAATSGQGRSPGTIVLQSTSTGGDAISVGPVFANFSGKGAGSFGSQAGHVTAMSPGGINLAGVDIRSESLEQSSLTVRNRQVSYASGVARIFNGAFVDSGTETVSALSFDGSVSIGGRKGAVNASSLSATAEAGTVTIEASRGVTIGGSILTSHKASSGGDVNINAGLGPLVVNGTIDASSGAGAGISAGDITLHSSTFVSVGGSIIARGGGASSKSTVPNAGAGGGNVTLTTNENVTGAEPRPYRIGEIVVSGSIDVSGGTGALLPGGDGGTLQVDTGAFRVSGKARDGSSINANGAAGSSPGADGAVTINTFGTQPLPVAFDSQGTVKTLFAIPGGLFVVGNAEANGVAGTIVSGTTISSTTPGAARIVDGSPLISGNVSITASGSSFQIDEGGSTVTVSVDNFGEPGVLIPVRTRVTSGEAMALFQVSRDGASGAQTVALNALGQVVGQAGPLSSEFSVPDFEMAQPFTAFSLSTVDGTGLVLNITGLSLLLNLSQASMVDLSGSLNFVTTGSSGLINLGAKSLVIPAGGAITGVAGAHLAISGNGTTWTNDGVLRVGELDLVAAESLTIAMGPAAQLGGPDGGDGVTRVFAQSLNLTGGTLIETTLSFVPGSSNGSLTVDTAFGTGAQIGSMSVGSLDVRSTSGSGTDVTIAAGAVVTTSSALTLVGDRGVNIGDAVIVTANSDNVAITAMEGDLTIGASGQFTANGGNIVMLASGTVSGGAGNTFTARASGTASQSSGGGIEIGSGLTSSTGLADALQQPAGTAPSPAALGTNVAINNGGGTLGVVQANTSGGGTIDLSSSGASTATLNVNRGAMIFDAVGAGASIELDGATFTTDAFLPIAYRPAAVVELFVEEATEEQLRPDEPGLPRGSVSVASIYVSGHNSAHTLRVRGRAGKRVRGASGCFAGSSETVPGRGDLSGATTAGKGTASVTMTGGTALFHAARALTVRTQLGDVRIRKGALASVGVEAGVLRVIACSGPGDVTVVSEGHEVMAGPGQEILICDGLPAADTTNPGDGIGRRLPATYELGKRLTATVSEVSLVTVLGSATHTRALRHAGTAQDRNVRNRLLKTAAAIEAVTRTRGRYVARPAVPVETSGWRYASGRSQTGDQVTSASL